MWEVREVIIGFLEVIRQNNSPTNSKNRMRVYAVCLFVLQY
jgi:hypothetical protein